MQMHHDIDDEFMPSDTGGQRERVYVRFDLRPRQDDEASAREGRPIFNDVEYITIRAPGERDEVMRPISVEDRQRFAAQYSVWKKTEGNVTGLSGMPLAQWSQVTRSQVEELAFFHVRTVEQLADVSDSSLQRMGPLRKLRDLAKDYVAKAKGDAPAVALRQELAAAHETIEDLKRIVKEQGERLDALSSASKVESKAKAKG